MFGIIIWSLFTFYHIFSNLLPFRFFDEKAGGQQGGNNNETPYTLHEEDETMLYMSDNEDGVLVVGDGEVVALNVSSHQKNQPRRDFGASTYAEDEVQKDIFGNIIKGPEHKQKDVG